MESLRIKKVNELIRRELAKIILKEVDFPQEVLATLTKVETSKDLARARVFVSVMPSSQTKLALQTLNREIYSLQQGLNKRLKMRPIPRIEFCQDKEIEKQAHIEQILENFDKPEQM